MQPKAIILLSGGLDSATVAAHAIADGYEAIALSFNYGQRHERELVAAHQRAFCDGRESVSMGWVGIDR
jgi:7-cyano-7-deazaguanine synthase